jgi:hypothetical protein
MLRSSPASRRSARSSRPMAIVGSRDGSCASMACHQSSDGATSLRPQRPRKPIFPSLAPEMAPDGPMWVEDITYVAIATGFVYLGDPGCLVTTGCRLRDQPLDRCPSDHRCLEGCGPRAGTAGGLRASQRARLAIRGSRLPATSQSTPRVNTSASALVGLSPLARCYPRFTDATPSP